MEQIDPNFIRSNRSNVLHLRSIEQIRFSTMRLASAVACAFINVITNEES